MPEAIRAEQSLITKTVVKTRTKVGVVALALFIGTGMMAGIGSILSTGKVCDSGSRVGQACRVNLDCRVRSTDRTARCTGIKTPHVASTLYAVTSGDSPASNIIVGGSVNVPVLNVEFVATGESFIIRKLRIKNDRAEDSNGISSLIISYPQADGTTAQRTGILVGVQADFNDLNFYVPQDSRALLQVMANTIPITIAGISGDTPQLSLSARENFEAFGNTSARIITYANRADIVGEEMVLRKTKPMVRLSPASPSYSIAGLNEVLRFTISADPAGDVVLDGLTFRVNSTDNATPPSGWNISGDDSGNIDLASAYSLYDANDLSTPLESGDSDWVLFGYESSDGVLSGGETVGYARLMFTTPRIIAAGTTKTFILKVDTTGASPSADDTVRFSIIGENESYNTALRASTEFQWDEVGAGSETNISGYLVRMLPVVGNALVY